MYVNVCYENNAFSSVLLRVCIPPNPKFRKHSMLFLDLKTCIILDFNAPTTDFRKKSKKVMTK